MTLVGLKKEWLYMWRGGRFIALLLVFLGFAALETFVTYMSSQHYVAEQLAELNISVPPSVAYAVAGSVGDIASAVLILFLILTASMAGTEQRKRSVIIPYAAGLSPLHYTLPKFILYPLLAIVLSIINALFAFGFGSILFGAVDITFLDVVATGALAGLNVAFMTCIMMMFGIMTGRGGLCAGLTIGGFYIYSIAVAGISEAVGYTVLDKFNPMNLPVFATALPGASYSNYNFVEHIGGEANLYGTIAITIGVMIICFLVAWFSQKASRSDNSGDEAVI